MKKKIQDQQIVNDQSNEWKEKYVRALADYQNLEKRTNERINETRKYAEEHIIRVLLPVLDNLKLASAHIQDEGLQHVVRQFETVLKEAGVIRLDHTGKQFDPHEMECIELTNGKHQEVVDVVTPGYKIHDKIIRVSRVRVGQETNSSPPPQTKEEIV
jgi:molecular chaperone GrpE (heat shock protein)